VAAGNAQRTATELAQTTAAGEPSDSSQPGSGGAVAAGNAQRTPTELAQTTAPASGHGDDVTLRRDGSQAVPFVSDLDPEPATAANGFDWGSAAVGAGAAMALVALAGAALLTIRRRAPVSPSAPTS
jgi:hypothetical protein